MSIEGQNAHGANPILFLATCGFLSPILTFAIAMTSLSAQTKISALAFVATAYASLFYFVYRRSFRRGVDLIDKSLPGAERSNEEVHISVDTSVGSEETFRAVIQSLRERLPIENAALFEIISGGEIKPVVVDDREGFDAERRDLALYKMAGLSGEIESEIDQVAIPFAYDGRIFAVLGIELALPIDEATLATDLTSLRDEMAPKFAAAFAYDRRVSTALADAVTGLPNERAFLMVLEHQLAESLRHRDERPMSVIAFDIRSFAKINEEYGHAIGDRILMFAAETMRGHFRAMDFLARTHNDEFLAVVPMADGASASDIVFRISNVFAERGFELDNENSISISVNFGIATFWQDGETSHQLIQNAQFKKQQAKAEDTINTGIPEKEYVH